MALISCKDLEFENGGTLVLRGVSFEVEKGEIMAITGPSGSGKSTLLRLVADLISPTAGEIFYKNKHINTYEPTAYRSMVRYVPQTPKLFAGTVQDNLEFVYKIHQMPFITTESEKLLESFEMPVNYLAKDVSKLSGGEKQRLALIRSLLFTPEVLLLDEPTSSLDAKNTRIVEKALKQYHELGSTMLWITHDEQQRQRVADRTLVIESGKVAHMPLGGGKN